MYVMDIFIFANIADPDEMPHDVAFSSGSSLFTKAHAKVSSIKKPLFFCLLGNFHAFLSSADFFSSKSTFLKSSFSDTIRVSSSLNPDQAQHFVGPDLDPNCLLRLSAEDTSRQRINNIFLFSVRIRTQGGENLV